MNTTRYKHSVLGLVLLSLMSFDAFAETRGSSLSGNHHSGQLTLDAVYGDKGNSHSSLDLLYPLYERSDAIAFVDIRGMSREGPVSEFNLGGGYRWLNDKQSHLYGVYGFYDARQSAASNNYTQLTLGGEWKTERWSLGGNVYLPMGSQKDELSRKASSTAPELVNNPEQAGTFLISLNDDVLYEYAYQGLDVEAGYQVAQLPGLTTYLGAYHFTHKEADAITGPRLSVEYDVLQHIKQVPSWLGSVDVVASVQHDAVRDTLWSVGMRVSIPLGSQTSKRKLTGLKKALTAVVRRDIDIVTSTSTTVEEKALFTQDDGTPYVLKTVATSEELLAATTSASGAELPANIVALVKNINVKGKTNGTAAEGLLTTTAVTRDTDAVIVLPDDLMLIGGDMTITFNNIEYTLPIPTEAACAEKCSITLVQKDAQDTFVQTGHLIRVGKNNTLQNITLIVPPGDVTHNLKGQQSAAITNTKGIIQANDTLTDEKIAYDKKGSHFEPFGNLTLTNVDVTGGGMVYFNVDDDDAASVSTVTITGGTYNITNPYVGKSYDVDGNDLFTHFGAITLIDQGDGTKLGNHQLSDMTLMMSQALAAPANESPIVSAIAVSYLGEGGNIAGNNITDVSATGTDIGAIGISVTGDVKGTIGCAISTNTACQNTFAPITSTAAAAGIYAGSLTGGKARISGNTFNGAITGNELAIGILAQGNVSGTIGCGADETINCANKFGVIASSAGYAAGVFVVGGLGDGTAANAGTIKGNTFERVIGFEGLEPDDLDLPVSGIVVGGAVNTGSSISGNQFGVRVDGSRITGVNAIDATAAGATAGVAGIYLIGNISGTIGCGADETINCANKFGVIASSAGHAAGVFVLGGLGDGTAANPALIKGNTFERVIGFEDFDHDDLDLPVSGILVLGVNTGSSISDNQFGVGVDGSRIIGVNAIDATADDATAGVAGIYVDTNVFGTIGCGADETINCANKFGVIESATGHAAGVFVNVNLGVDGDTIGTIKGNTFERVIGFEGFRLNDLVPVSGILALSVNTGSSISDNQFGVTVDGSRIIGVNAIDATAAGATAGVAGIYVHTNFFGTIGCGADETINCANKFGVIESSAGHAAGVFVIGGLGDGTAANAGTIKGNTFERVIGFANDGNGYYVSGILVEGAVNTGSSISGNQFGMDVDGDAITTGNAIEAIAAEATASVAGIYAVDLFTDGVIDGNTFYGISGKSSTVGVYVEVTGTNEMQGMIIDNVFNVDSSGTYAIKSTDGNAAGIHISYPMSGIISGNQFNGAIGGSVAFGIFVAGAVSGTIGCGADETINCANKFGVIASSAGYAAGVFVVGGLGDGTAANPALIKGNTFERVIGFEDFDPDGLDLDFPVSGILVLSVNTGSSISDNQFGVRVDGSRITGVNAIDATAAGATAGVAGIYLIGNTSGTIGCGADETINCANKFGVIESSAGHAAGVYVFGALGDGTAANPALIKGNTFERVIGFEDFDLDGLDLPVSGILVKGAVNTGSSISGNQFGMDVDGDAITTGNAIEAIAKDATADVVGINVIGAVTGTIGCAEGEEDTACGNIFKKGITSTDGIAYGVYANDLLAGGIIDSNMFAGISARGIAYGVYVDVTGTNEMQGDITNNVFNNDAGGTYAIRSTESFVHGIYVVGAMQGVGEDVSKISGNHFNGAIIAGTESGAGDAHGIWMANDVSGMIASNTFNGIYSKAGEAAGIRLQYGNTGADGQKVTIMDNTFNTIAGGDYAIKGKKEVRGIYFGRGLAAEGKVEGNTFADIISTESEAYGFYFDDEMKGEVAANSITVVVDSTLKKAYGMFFKASLTDGAAANITNNVLRVSAGIENAGAFGFRLLNNTGRVTLVKEANENEFARGDGTLLVITGNNTPPGATCSVDGGDC